MVKKGYMPTLRPVLAIIALALAAPLPSTAHAQDTHPPSTLAPGSYRWLEDGPWSGPIYMIISIERQMVHVYSGDRLIGAASVSTGMKGHSTPKGEFAILQKRQWHRSNIYSNAPMPFMQRLTWDGIALHGGHNPGYPASHGCIRLPQAFARKLFEVTQLGTLVRVTSDQLSPTLMVDALILGDPGSAVVTFTPRAEKPLVQQAALDLDERAPMLAIDPSVFRPRLRRR